MDTETGFRLSKRIRLTIGVVYLSTYYKHDDRGMIAKAKDVLDQHNIDLDVFPALGQKTPQNTIQTDFEPEDTAEDYGKVYKMAKDKLKLMGCNFVIPLPVVFGKYKSRGWGIAPKVPGQLTRLVMLYPEGNADKMDLVHELGHAAGLEHDLRSDDQPRNFMHVASPRSVLYKYQIEALGKAPYSVG